MTYTPLQIEIIKKFGRKELTEGCTILSQDTPDDNRILRLIRKFSEDWECFINEMWDICHYKSSEFKILWHLPHLEDIFRVAEEELWKIWVSDVNKIEWAIRGYSIVFIRPYESWITPYSPTLPLIEQDETTLSQLLSLFK